MRLPIPRRHGAYLFTLTEQILAFHRARPGSIATIQQGVARRLLQDLVM